MQTYGNKHVLQLKNVRETDFGNYSCMADNSLGRQRGSIEVSGEFFLLLLTDRTCESSKKAELGFRIKWLNYLLLLFEGVRITLF